VAVTTTNRRIGVLSVLGGIFLASGCGDDLKRPGIYERASLSRGAHLYDDWLGVTGTTPTGDNPGYAQTQGKAKGAATWRCKECHGVDYRGVDGFYSSGSHFTGVAGLVQSSSEDESALFTGIHDACFGPATPASGSQLSDADVWDLVKFIREGVVDLTPYLDATGVPINGDPANGKLLYEGQCVRCHGADGSKLNIGSAVSVSYIGTEANKNGFNFQHRVRFGLVPTPGTLKQEMPAAVNFGWSMGDIRDVLTYARTLPTK